MDGNSDASIKKRKSRITKGARKSISQPHLTTLCDINDDCLREIFKFLDTLILTKMCRLNERLKNVICQQVIPTKTINFTELAPVCSTQKVFEMYGKYMTRINISCKNIQFVQPNCTPFAECLRLITTHCEPGRLRELHFNEFVGLRNDSIPQDVLNALTTCLSNVHTLQFTSTNAVFFNISIFMQNMPKKNLRNLFVNNVYEIGDWLTVELFPNLENLQIFPYKHSVQPINNANFNKIQAYIAQNPALKQFKYSEANHEAILIELSRHIPHLSSIGTLKNRMIPSDNNNNRSIEQRVREKWKFLNEFSKLNEFSLESKASNFGNCGEIFRILSVHNTIEHLELISNHFTMQDHCNPINVAHLRELTNVKSLKLIDFGRAHSDTFFNMLFENLIGLTECSFIGGSIKQGPILSLVQNVHNLRVLSINTKVTAFSAILYKKIVKHRVALKDSTNTNTPLVINIDKKIMDDCKEALGSRAYKPSIVFLKSKQW